MRLRDKKPERRCFSFSPCDDSLSCIFFGSLGLKGSEGWWFWLGTQPRPLGLVSFPSRYLLMKIQLQSIIWSRWKSESWKTLPGGRIVVFFFSNHTHTNYILVLGLCNLDKYFSKRKFYVLCLGRIIHPFNIWDGFRSLGFWIISI